MITHPTSEQMVETVRVPVSFPEWRHRLQALQVPAVIAVAGSRGKTTVVRLLDAIFRAAGLRTALWTNQGVEINGRRQRGELVPWTRALVRLREASLDVAIQELDWSTVHAVGLPPEAYPVVAITNLCVNNDSCLIQTESLRAARALRQIRTAAHRDGLLVLNGEDFAVAEQDERVETPAVLVGLSRDTPLVRNHLRRGGLAVWSMEDQVWCGGRESSQRISRLRELEMALGGAIGFQVHNALMATAAARACGIPPATIAEALREFAIPPTLMPGSFNVVAIGSSLVVVDRPAPSWFLRSSLRAMSHLPGRRLLTVVGQVEAVPEADLVETGRLLGRGGGALILHGNADAPDRAALLRQGIAANPVPPVVVHVGTERQAIARALKMLRSDDRLYVLADQPAAVLRALARARARTAGETFAGQDERPRRPR